jgi:ABC-2 type transport system ATP-binding protein
MSDREIIITVKDIKKQFGEVEALAGIDFTINRGELFGFLGPNGAGKTTTINILTGLARPDSGVINISGIDCRKHPRSTQHLIGVVPDESNLYPELTGFENLCFCASLYGVRKRVRQERAVKLLRDFGLNAAANRKFGGYSKGMKRKITIAAGIIHQPEILFLDEPTTGIDVASARQVRELISELHHAGTTIFLTTHYIEEAERLCDRIAFIVGGRIVRIDTKDNLLQPVQDKKVLRITVNELPELIMSSLAEKYPGFTFTLQGNDILQIEAAENIPAGRIVHFLEEEGVEVSEARKVQPALEEVFVKITGIGGNLMKKEKEQSGGKA